MAIAFVNRVGTGSTASASSIASASQSITAGNLVVALFIHDPTASPTGVPTDTALNTYAPIGTALACLDGQKIHGYYAKNCLGNATNVVTLSLDASVVYRAATVLQFSGCDTTSPLDDAKTATGTGTSAATASLTLSEAEGVVVSFQEANADSWSGGSGFSLVAFNFTGDATNYLSNQYKIVTASQTASATCGSGNWNMFAAMFKAPSAGGHPTMRRWHSIPYMGRRSF